MRFGTRRFRTHIDPSEDGAEIVVGVADRVRAEMFRRIGLEDLLKPAVHQTVIPAIVPVLRTCCA